MVVGLLTHHFYYVNGKSRALELYGNVAINCEHIEDFADMAGIEYVLIDSDTKISEFKKELRWNEMYYMLAKSVC
jgi:hypothetical protein